MEIINLVIAFNLGLFSTLHCLGMCGGIIGALSLGVDNNQDRRIGDRFKFSVAYNTGRISSYTVAGAIAGFSGQYLVTGILPAAGHQLLQFLAAGVLVLIGLHLAGWLPRLGRIEAIGLSFWRYIQPVGRRFLPVRNTGQAYVIGMIWGWLPCALVYSVLLWTLAAGSAGTGAALMFVFGLGTLPGMVSAGIAGGSLQEMLKHRKLRIWTGIIIIVFGITSPFLHFAFNKDTHKHHHELSAGAVNQDHLYHHYPLISDWRVFQDHHTGRI